MLYFGFQFKWLIVFSAFCILGFSLFANAEPVRIAIGDVLVSDTDLQSNENASGLCELWCALLTNNLSETESVEILEREQLSNIIHEFQISLSNKSASALLVNELSEVDFFILNEMKSGESGLSIESRLVSAKEGAVVSQFQVTIDANNIEEQCADVTAKIKEYAINYSDTKIKLLVAITDFENNSPLERNDWIETSIPRRLREAIGTLLEVRILEREEVDLLLQEVRLKNGGYIDENSQKQFNDNKKTILITGTFDEYQPLNEQVSLEFSIILSDIESSKQKILNFDFQINQFDRGLENIKNDLITEIKNIIANDITKPNNVTNEQKEFEAKVNFDKAIQLMGFDDINKIIELGYNTLWGIRSYEFFSLTRHPFDSSPARHANILKAIRYLKISVMLNNNDIYTKELLAVLLADNQIRDMELATELAFEVAARNRDSTHERDALLFLYNHVQESEQQEYFDLLIEKYKGSYAAQVAIRNLTLSLPDKDTLTLDEKIEKAMKIMPIAMEWQSDNHFVEIQIQTLFKLTQLNDEYKTMGNEFIEQMILSFPSAAVYICNYWAYQWDYIAKDSDNTIYWCRRGLDLFNKIHEFDSKYSIEKNLIEFMLGQNLYKTKQYRKAIEAFENCTLAGYRDRAVYYKSVCQFNLGDYEEALAGFESLGKFNTDGNAADWANNTRQVMGITEKTNWTQKEAVWIKPDSKLPAKYISALALDGEDIWIGTTHPAATLFGEGHNLVMLEKNPEDLKNAQKEGGLFRYDTKTKKLEAFQLGRDISSLWINDIHIKDNFVFVGTYGGGLDIFDKQKDSWSNLSKRNGLASDYVQCMDSDEKFLWLGTGRYGKGGVSRINLKTNEVFTFLPRDFSPSAQPPTCYVNQIKVIDNFVWCTLGKNGVCSYDIQKNTWKTHKIEFPFHSLETMAVFNQRIWFGASEGNKFILSCNLDGSDWQTLSGKENIPEIGIFCMNSTDEYLLLGTYGLMTIDANDNISAYDLRSGFTTTDILPLSNQVWIGTHNGIKILKLP